MIVATGLQKHYGSVLAVDDLSFTVRPGQVTGFLGPNGSGKSTTMRLIMGLDRPDAGHVEINGRPYRGLGWPLREVGALLEARAYHPGRSARAHLLALAQTNDIPRSRVDEVLDMVGLSAAGRRRAGKFSLGMGQRLGIAGALLGDPGVLLFDEPVNGLDPEGIRWVRNLLKGLAKEGRSVLVSSHLMSEMAVTADHLVIIGRGQLITETPMRDFLASSSKATVLVKTPQAEELRGLLDRHEEVTVDEPEDGGLLVTGMDAPTLGELCTAQAIVLHELTPQMASLEEAFMELTHDSVEYRSDHVEPEPLPVDPRTGLTDPYASRPAP